MMNDSGNMRKNSFFSNTYSEVREVFMKRVVQFRRDLHQIPELHLTLPKTKAYLMKHLKTLPCKVIAPISSSICAFFDFHQSDTIAFRSDMDALKIKENVDVSYISIHEGNMHACGHDGHMAMLLEFAYYISTLSTYSHNIMLIFQPGEEHPGGARLLCETGLLQQYRVKKIFGMHIWPQLEKGVIAVKEGAMMAAGQEINVEVKGKSTHVAYPQNGRDALRSSIHFLQACELLQEKYPEAIVKFNMMQSGESCNVIPSYAILKGTMRTFDDKTCKQIKDALFRIKEVCEKTDDTTMIIHYQEGYPIVWNDPNLTNACIQKFVLQRLEKPSYTSEDFSYYQQEVPGVFFFLGSGSKEMLHSDTFSFDEDILEVGVQFYQRLLDLFKE